MTNSIEIELRRAVCSAFDTLRELEAHIKNGGKISKNSCVFGGRSKHRNLILRALRECDEALQITTEQERNDG